MIKESVKAHGRFQLEIKQKVSFDRRAHDIRYRIETWFFLPAALQVSPDTYSPKTFQQNLKNYIRLRPPTRKLAQLLEPEEMLAELAAFLADKPDKNEVERYENVLKRYALTYKRALRLAIKWLERDPKKRDAAAIGELLAEIHDVLTAWRALENALPQLKDGKSLHFLFLPEEHDPDSYVRAYGKAQFEDALLHQSEPLSEYFWDALSDGLNLNMQEGKAELVKTSSPLLAQITAPALGFLLKQRLSELVGIDPDNLAQLLGQEAPKRHVKQKSYKLPAISVKQPVMLTLVQRQIRSLLINPAWASYIDLPEYLPLTGDFACLANLAEMIKSHPQPPSSAQILEHMRGSPYETALNQIFQSALNSSDEMESGNEEDCESFKIGMKKLLNELKYSQIELLKQKSSQSGLNDYEKQLLMSLLISKAN